MLVFVDLDGESSNAIPLYGPRWNNLRHKELSMILCWQYFAFGSSGMQLQKNYANCKATPHFFHRFVKIKTWLNSFAPNLVLQDSLKHAQQLHIQAETHNEA